MFIDVTFKGKNCLDSSDPFSALTGLAIDPYLLGNQNPEGEARNPTAPHILFKNMTWFVNLINTFAMAECIYIPRVALLSTDSNYYNLKRRCVPGDALFHPLLSLHGTLFFFNLPVMIL